MCGFKYIMYAHYVLLPNATMANQCDCALFLPQWEDWDFWLNFDKKIGIQPLYVRKALFLYSTWGGRKPGTSMVWERDKRLHMMLDSSILCPSGTFFFGPYLEAGGRLAVKTLPCAPPGQLLRCQ